MPLIPRTEVGNERNGQGGIGTDRWRARAAYQVGVLVAIREIRGRDPSNPFRSCAERRRARSMPALAVAAHDFNAGVRRLARVWRNFSVDQVHRSDARAIIGTGARWGSCAAVRLVAAPDAGVAARQFRCAACRTHARLLRDRRAIQDGNLHAVSVTASGYATGESLSFFEATPRSPAGDVPSAWACEPGSASITAGLERDSVVFLRSHREFFGDGSMRQLAPVSPAVHLGADRIPVVGPGAAACARSAATIILRRRRSRAMPCPASSSTAWPGLERLQRINTTVSALSPNSAPPTALNQTHRNLVIAPSQSLETIAPRYRASLPPVLRAVLRGGRDAPERPRRC